MFLAHFDCQRRTSDRGPLPAQILVVCSSAPYLLLLLRTTAIMNQAVLAELFPSFTRLEPNLGSTFHSLDHNLGNPSPAPNHSPSKLDVVNGLPNLALHLDPR